MVTLFSGAPTCSVRAFDEQIHEFVTLNSVPQRVARKRKELNFSLRKLQVRLSSLTLLHLTPTLSCVATLGANEPALPWCAGDE